MENNKIYAVVEKWYNSTTGTGCNCKNGFNTLKSAQQYVQKELKKDLEYYISIYVDCDDKNGLKEFKKSVRTVKNNKSGFYGIYPYDGEKEWAEYKICQITIN